MKLCTRKFHLGGGAQKVVVSTNTPLSQPIDAEELVSDMFLIS